MSFFNNKEEVLKIKLTQYGKALLGTGRFKPEFYAFYDDDILYDGSNVSGSHVEYANLTSKRIKEETPRMHTQYVYSGVELKGNKINALSGLGKNDNPNHIPLKISTFEREYALGLPIGTSNTSEYSPAFSVKILKGKLLNVNQVLTGSSNQEVNLRIPQLDIEKIEFVTSAKGEVLDASELETVINTSPLADNSEKPCDDATSFVITTQGEAVSKVYFSDDNSYIEVEEDELIIEIEELNADTGLEKFDIEVFEVQDPAAGDSKHHQILKPLYFLEKNYADEEDIIREEGYYNEIEDQIYEFGYESDHVEYYFDLMVYEEIDKNLLCSLLPSDNPSQVYSKRLLGCQDVEEQDVSEKSLYKFPTVRKEEEC